MFQHISGVINDETKRLRFQVEGSPDVDVRPAEGDIENEGMDTMN